MIFLQLKKFRIFAKAVYIALLVDSIINVKGAVSTLPDPYLHYEELFHGYFSIWSPLPDKEIASKHSCIMKIPDPEVCSDFFI